MSILCVNKTVSNKRDVWPQLAPRFVRFTNKTAFNKWASWSTARHKHFDYQHVSDYEGVLHVPRPLGRKMVRVCKESVRILQRVNAYNMRCLELTGGGDPHKPNTHPLKLSSRLEELQWVSHKPSLSVLSDVGSLVGLTSLILEAIYPELSTLTASVSQYFSCLTGLKKLAISGYFEEGCGVLDSYSSLHRSVVFAQQCALCRMLSGKCFRS